MTNLIRHAERITPQNFSIDDFVDNLIAQMNVHDRAFEGQWKDICHAAIAYSKQKMQRQLIELGDNGEDLWCLYTVINFADGKRVWRCDQHHGHGGGTFTSDTPEGAVNAAYEAMINRS